MGKHSQGRHEPAELVTPGGPDRDLSLGALSHFSLAGSLAKWLKGNDIVAVAQQLDAIALNEPRRAAICLADAYQHRLPLDNNRSKYAQDPEYDLEKNNSISGINQVLAQLRSRDNVLRELRQLPTLDAARLRFEALEEPIASSAAILAAAVKRIAGNEESTAHLVGHLLRDGDLSEREKTTLKKESTNSARHFHALSDPQSLDLRHQALLEEFYQVTQESGLFRLERYGYEGVARELRRAKQKEIGGVALVKIPWSESFDLPNPDCHQCHESALTARSFFSARGIPADLWVGMIGSAQHTVTVVYFPVASGFKPVLVDVSPYGGMYAVHRNQGGEHFSFQSPAGVMAVRRVRNNPQPILRGDRLLAGHTEIENGLLPWFSHDLPDDKGRIVAMGGVLANQVADQDGWGEYGPAWRGRGIRNPKIVLELTLFPGVGSDFVRSAGSACGSLIVTRKKKDDRLKIIEADSNLSKEQIDAMLEVADERFSSVRKTVDRLDIDLSKRTFT